MKIFFYSFLWIILICNLIVTALGQGKDAGAVEKQIEVVLGMDYIFKVDFVPFKRIAIGNSAILDYRLLPQKKEIIFKGLKSGSTSALIRNVYGDLKYKLKVDVTTSGGKANIVKELKEFLGDVEGLDIGIKGGSVYLGGEIVVPNDIGIISAVMEKYKKEDILVLFQISPQTQRIIAQKMQEEMRNMKLKDVSVRIVNGVFWVEGVVTSPAQKKLAMEIAKGYAPTVLFDSLAQRAASRFAKKDYIVNFVSVNPAKSKPKPLPKLIKIAAQFVELKKDYNKMFAFRWMPSITPDQNGSIRFGQTDADGLTTQSSGTFSGIISNLFPQLISAKNAGHARVIQSGMVITKDKKKATINRKFNMPIELASRKKSVVTEFQFEINPQIKGKEKIDMSIGVTVKAGTSSNNIKTDVIVKSKESAVIGGIAINETQTEYDKDQPGEDLEIDTSQGASPLFSFLRSKFHLINKSQFVVFVTPEIIESTLQTTQEIKKKFRQRRR